MYSITFVFQNIQKTMHQLSFSSKTRLISYYSLRVIKTNESVSCLHSSLNSRCIFIDILFKVYLFACLFDGV
jgi:hypothetical protein